MPEVTDHPPKLVRTWRLTVVITLAAVVVVTVPMAGIEYFIVGMCAQAMSHYPVGDLAFSLLWTVVGATVISLPPALFVARMICQKRPLTFSWPALLAAGLCLLLGGIWTISGVPDVSLVVFDLPAFGNRIAMQWALTFGGALSAFSLLSPTEPQTPPHSRKIRGEEATK